MKIRDSFPAFHGRIVTETGACNGLREIKLYERKRNGERKLLGRTMSDLNGKWSVIVDPLASGAYLATAPKDDRSDVGFICERAKSRTLVVD